MPEPHPGETSADFVARCMADPEARRSFPRQDQRLAFCHSRAVRTKVAKVDEDRRVVYGWASVIEEGGAPVVDHDGDVIKADTLVDAVHGYVLDARAGKLMHRGRREADLVETLVFTVDLQKALGIDLGRVGWFVGFKVRGDALWDRVKQGEFPAFSIGGHGDRVAMVV